MSDPAGASLERPVLRWAAVGCQCLAIVAWALLVLRYQYGAAWLRRYDEASLDALFVLAVAAAAVARALDRRGRAARRVLALRLSLVTGTTVLMLVAAESTARFVFRHARSSSNPGDFIAQHSSGTTRIRVNGLGFREREIPPHTPGHYRIVVVGDSFTWGQGIEEGERFSNLLEQQLGPRYEVFNFGLPAHNMPEHLDVLTQALTVSPDFVLLQLYINDFETSEMTPRPYHYPLLPESLDRALGRSSLLYDLVQIAWVQVQERVGLAEGYVHFMERNLQDPDGPNARKALGQLKEFFERARAAGMNAGAVLFPDTKTIGRRMSYPFAYLHDDVRRVCSDEEVQCLDLLPMFTTFRDQSAGWVSPFDAHPNAFANREASYYILQTFGTAWH